jgi:outer membrane biosynthesis protein TonB
MRSMTRLALLLLGVALTAACASGRAQVIEDRPTLAVPPVPERSIEPQPPPPLPTVEPMVEASPIAASSPKPRPTARNPESRQAEAKPENQPEATTAATTPPPAPVAPLRSSSTPSGPEAVKQIREILQRTEGILSRIDYQKLGLDRRATYDGAKHWIQQCEEKIKQEDLLLALNFAKRAEEAAKSLETGR